jgi:hypothetical protein
MRVWIFSRQGSARVKLVPTKAKNISAIVAWTELRRSSCLFKLYLTGAHGVLDLPTFFSKSQNLLSILSRGWLFE